MSCFARLVLCVAVCSVPAIARAAPPPAVAASASAPYPGPYAVREADAGRARKGEDFTARPLAIYSHLSLGGPFGSLGGALDYSLSRYVAVEAGGGKGFTGADIGAMLLPRLPLSRGFAIGAGVGLSGTFNYADTLACNSWVSASCTPPRWSFAPFANGEVYLEGRTGLGFSVRGYVGAWRILDSTPDVPCDQCTGTDLALPYVGVAVGWAL